MTYYSIFADNRVLLWRYVNYEAIANEYDIMFDTGITGCNSGG
jgi:hypothetical protein